MLHDTRLDDLGGEIDNGADYSPRLDGARDYTAGIDALQMHLFEEPPGDAVLHADDGGLRSEQRLQTRRKIDQAVGLDSEKDDVGRADLFQIPAHRWARFEIAL